MVDITAYTSTSLAPVSEHQDGVIVVDYAVAVVCSASSDKAGQRFRTALSTTNNGASDQDLVTLSNITSVSSIVMGQNYQPQARWKFLSLAAKTTYYLNAMQESGTVNSLQFAGTVATSFIRAVSDYV